MNLAILMGRLVKEPVVRYTTGESPMAVGRYTLAVERVTDSNAGGEKKADFISCIVFGRTAEVAEKYLSKGSRVLVSGHIRTGSYVNKDRQKIFTTEVNVHSQRFLDYKGANDDVKGDDGNHQQTPQNVYGASDEDFMNIPEGIDDDLPFR